MDNQVRNHIRTLLWSYQNNKKELTRYREIINQDYEGLDFFKPTKEWSVNKLVFRRTFVELVSDILEDATTEMEDLFLSKYKNGYSGKKNDIVAYETHLSESTVKRIDNAFIKEIASRLGWN